MDTEKEPTINVHVGGGKILNFEEVESGLYLFRAKHNKRIAVKKLVLTLS